MKNSLLFVFLFIPLSLSSQSNEILELNLEPIIESPSENVNLSTIADSISYIKLRTPISISIGRIRQVCFDDTLLFVHDKSDVYCFNNEGDFLNKIGNSGNGIGQYLKINSIALNPHNEQIYILDNKSGKILQFDYSGNFLSEFITNQGLNDIAVLNDQYLTTLVSNSNTFKNDDYRISIRNLEGIPVSKLLDYSVYEIPPYGIGMGGMIQFFYSDGNLLFWDFIGTSLFEVVDENTITKKIELNFGKYLPPPEMTYQETDSKKYYEYVDEGINKYFTLTQCVKTNSYLFIFGLKRYREYIVYNLESETFLNPTIDWLLFPQGLFNDFDGGQPFWPIGAKNDSVLYMPFNTKDLGDIAKHNLYGSFIYDKPNTIRSIIDSDLSSTQWIMMVYLK